MQKLQLMVNDSNGHLDGSAILYLAVSQEGLNVLKTLGLGNADFLLVHNIHPFWFLGLSLSFDYIVPHYLVLVKRFFQTFFKNFCSLLVCPLNLPYSVTHFGKFVKPFLFNFQGALPCFLYLLQHIFKGLSRDS